MVDQCAKILSGPFSQRNQSSVEKPVSEHPDLTVKPDGKELVIEHFENLHLASSLESIPGSAFPVVESLDLGAKVIDVLG